MRRTQRSGRAHAITGGEQADGREEISNGHPTMSHRSPFNTYAHDGPEMRTLTTTQMVAIDRDRVLDNLRDTRPGYPTRCLPAEYQGFPGPQQFCRSVGIVAEQELRVPPTGRAECDLEVAEVGGDEHFDKLVSPQERQYRVR